MTTNMITRAVSKFKDFVWRFQFDRTPIKKLGNLLVKDFRGALYAVDVEDVTPMTLHVARNKALGVYEIYKSNGQILLYVKSKKEAKRLTAAVNSNAR